jgi:O-methyltransferase
MTPLVRHQRKRHSVPFKKKLSVIKSRLLARWASPISADLESDAAFGRIYKIAKPFTMTSPERMYGLYQAVRYVSQRAIDGDFVECGVWRGGSSILAALTFAECGEKRKHHLFDTFEGMPPPTDEDIDFRGVTAEEQMLRASKADVTYDVMCAASISDVRANIMSCGCDPDQFNLVVGRVEDTLPTVPQNKISILRLDTDWYNSTRLELEVLYPRLESGGVLIIDDYGHWSGAKKAVDEYFRVHTPILLNRLDYTGRIGVKP